MASATVRTDHALMFRCPCNSPASRLQRTWLWLHTTEHSSFLDQVCGAYLTLQCLVILHMSV